ncbi:tetratricopeptide repeat protein [Sphingomonas sp. CJ20]
MTSSRKRRTFPPMLRRALVVGAGLAVFAAILVGWFAMAPTRADPAAAQAATARSVALLQNDNATAARDAAFDAVRADPANAQAHLALAKAMLALEDGLGAEAELQRAVDTGYPAALVAHLRAEALLLQGDADKALAQADKTDPRFRADGLRIRGRALTAKGDYAGALAALDEAARIAPNDADVLVDTGRFKLTAGDVLGAIQASERAVKLAPGHVPALLLRGLMVRTQYGPVASLPWFESALRRDPAYTPALIEYAATLGDVGRTVDALAVTRRALDARPGSPQALYLQAVIAARAGNTELARTLLDRTDGALAALPGAQLLSATLDLQAGANEQAIDTLRGLLGTQPMNLTARKLLAIALLRTDSARNAIDTVRPVVARGDADSYALALVARGFERIGDRAAAARLLDRAAYPATAAPTAFSADDSAEVLAADAALRPDDPGATLPMLRALIDQGNTAGALARAQAIAAKNPGAPAAQLLVGDTLMLLNRPADAATAYRRAADLRFDQPVMLRLVDALDGAGRREDAANVLALYLSQNPIDIAALRLSGQWQLAAGDYDAAIDTLETLRGRIGDGDAVLNAELATAYAEAGEVEAAQELGEAAYALAPSNVAVVDAFGWALYRGGDLTGAAELLQKAVALAPRHAGLRWHLAQVYADMRRPADARAQVQAAMADPGFADRAAATALLAKLG